MSDSWNKNLKVAGFFGQSGSGKTTIIRNVKKSVNGRNIYQNVGIIRYLFGKLNSNGECNYTNPQELIDNNYEKISKLEGKEKAKEIDAVYEKYIRSQFQLLNDWSSEVFSEIRSEYTTPSILLVDRSPIDFYTLTLCGLKELKSKFGKTSYNNICQILLRLLKETAEYNSNTFINAIFVTKPWKADDINNLKDGVRDQYLQDYYTGDNWYSRYKDIKLTKTMTFNIDENTTDLQERANLVNKCLEEV